MFERETAEFFARGEFGKNSFPNRILKRQLVLFGLAGTGTSTQLKELHKRFPHFQKRSGGDYHREEAARKGITLHEHMLQNCADPAKGFDRACDEYLFKAFLQFPNGLLEEARLVAMLSQGCAYLVRLEAATHICAERCLPRLRVEEKRPDLTVGQAEELLIERNLKDIARFDKLYPGWNWPKSDFDLVIDTGETDQLTTTNLIEDGFNRWCAEKFLTSSKTPELTLA